MDNSQKLHESDRSQRHIHARGGEGDVLMILQPRQIPEAVRSLEALTIDKIWFRAMTEVELAPRLNRFIADTTYDNYLIVSDDVCVSSAALERSRELLKSFPAVTGYCRLDVQNPLVNLTCRPVRMSNQRCPRWEDYDFFRYDDVQTVDEAFPSWFGGWSLTGLRRKLWIQFPFRVNASTKAQSDFETAYRLAQAGLPFMTHRETYIEHLKRYRFDLHEEHWLIGKQPPSADWQPHGR